MTFTSRGRVVTYTALMILECHHVFPFNLLICNTVKIQLSEKIFEMLHLYKTILSTIFNNNTKHRNGEDGLFLQKLTGFNQIQSYFGLSKVQFHWIVKYLCKIEIVENSIFILQVFPPQDSKLLGYKTAL